MTQADNPVARPDWVRTKPTPKPFFGGGERKAGYLITGLIGALVVFAGVTTFMGPVNLPSRREPLIAELMMLRGVVTVFLGLKIIGWAVRRNDVAKATEKKPTPPQRPRPPQNAAQPSQSPPNAAKPPKKQAPQPPE